ALGTPGSRLKKWRSTLRNTYILKVQEFAITNTTDLEHAVAQLRLRKMMKAKITVATDRSYGGHPMEGILQIYFDQMNVIAKHLEEIAKERKGEKSQATIHAVHGDAPAEVNPESLEPPAEPPPPHPPPGVQVAESFTKKQLLKRSAWSE
ncbi:MAG: hypothetical protein ACK53Y_21910, partial [bacterium]